MSEIKVNSIKGVGASAAAITVNNSDGTCTANITNNLSNRSLWFNGKMAISQRGSSFTGIGGSAGVYSLDRYRSGSTMNAGRYTITQDSNAPDGFAKSLKVDVTTAEASLNAASAVQIAQFLEGQDLQQLQKGTSGAKSMTLSFYVKSTTIGTYIVEFQDQDNSRINNKAYTISSPNTWEKKTITVEGDTTGAFTNDNNASLLVQFYLAAGTNFTSGTLQNTWGTNTNANRAVGQTNLFASTSNDWAITGVQLEVGSVATDFEYRSFGQELALCQRYFFNVKGDNNYRSGITGFANSSANLRAMVQFPTPMRATPTVSGSSTNIVFDSYDDSDLFQCSEFQAGGSPTNDSPHMMVIEANPDGMTAGQCGVLEFRQNNGQINFSAEL